ncbi:MAG: glutaredoxin family protein [Ectothiorhodospira sp.]
MRGVSPTVTLYHREGCHLCETVLEGLGALQERLDFSIQAVDIDTDPALRERFGLKIPVVAVGEEILCCHRLDVAALEDALAP